jgi:hypothetical protein
MTGHRRTSITRAAAEQLLTGRAVRGCPALGRTLAAASAPPASGVLAGEARAMAQFHAANDTPVNEATSKRLMGNRAAKLLAGKVVAGVAVAVAAAGGGAALAATSHLPGRANGAAPSATAATGPHSTRSHDSDGGTPASRPMSSTPHGNSGSPRPSYPKGSPSPSLVGLCTAFGASVAANPGKALANPAFSALINAAGGKANVVTYCGGLLTNGRRTPHPGSSTHPAGTPAVHPSEPKTTGTQGTHPGARGTHPRTRATDGARGARPGARGTHRGARRTHPSAPSTHRSGPPSSPPSRH